MNKKKIIDWFDKDAKKDTKVCSCCQSHGTPKFVKLPFTGRILDAGCGYGRYTIPLAMKEGNEVVALDGSLSMLKRLEREKNNLNNIQIIKGDIANLPPLPINSFDTIICLYTFYYLHPFEWKQALKGFAKVLKEDGILYISFVKLNKNRIYEFLGEICILFGKKRSWIRNYYLPLFLIKFLLGFYFKNITKVSSDSFTFICRKR